MCTNVCIIFAHTGAGVIRVLKQSRECAQADWLRIALVCWRIAGGGAGRTGAGLFSGAGAELDGGFGSGSTQKNCSLDNTYCTVLTLYNAGQGLQDVRRVAAITLQTDIR